MEVQQFYYDNKVVKNFLYATMLWGIVGMVVGLGTSGTNRPVQLVSGAGLLGLVRGWRIPGRAGRT